MKAHPYNPFFAQETAKALAKGRVEKDSFQLNTEPLSNDFLT